MSKKKQKNFPSPIGEAKWAYLTKPSTRFASADKPDGTYQVDLILNPEDTEAKAFLEKLEALVDETYQLVTEGELVSKMEKPLTPAKIKNLSKTLAYSDDTDKDGNETGKVKVRFKRDAAYTDKDTKKKLKTVLPLFDSCKQKLEVDESFIIGNGSKIRINVWPAPYYNATANTVGVSLKINAVQIIELKQMERDADSFGFGDEGAEEGYAFDPDGDVEGSESGDF